MQLRPTRPSGSLPSRVVSLSLILISSNPQDISNALLHRYRRVRPFSLNIYRSCLTFSRSGTGSVRGLVADEHGGVVASASKPITTWRDPSDHRIFEQSTTDIWTAIATVVQRALADANIDPANVRGIGFDATCSLAVTDRSGIPAAVTKGKDCGALHATRNVILWADHRAEAEANLINTTPEAAPVLAFVGGTVSVSTTLCSRELIFV